MFDGRTPLVPPRPRAGGLTRAVGLALALFSALPATTAAAADGPWLTGRVVDAFGRPVAQARVGVSTSDDADATHPFGEALTAPEATCATTDGAGAFRLPASQGRIRVVAQRVGFRPGTTRFFWLPPGAGKDVGQIRLVPVGIAQLDLRTRTDAGQPVDGPVRLALRADRRQHGWTARGDTTVLSIDGRASVPLTAGRYRLFA